MKTFTMTITCSDKTYALLEQANHSPASEIDIIVSDALENFASDYPDSAAFVKDLSTRTVEGAPVYTVTTVFEQDIEDGCTLVFATEHEACKICIEGLLPSLDDEDRAGIIAEAFGARANEVHTLCARESGLTISEVQFILEWGSSTQEYHTFIEAHDASIPVV